MPDTDCSESEPFALRVLGDSMLPEFREGAVVIIDPSAVVEDGVYVIAEYNNEYIFRQFKIHDNKYYLQPLNDLYDTVVIKNTDVIRGVVTQKAGRKRSEHKTYSTNG